MLVSAFWQIENELFYKCRQRALSRTVAKKLNEYNKKWYEPFYEWQKMLTFTVSKGQIPVAVVRNNYLNNWAFKEKIDCLKAVFCGESIRGNHFFCLLDIVFLLISTRKDAWFFGFFCCSVTGLYDEVHCMGKSHQMSNLDSTPDLRRLYTYIFLRQNCLFPLKEIH